MMTSNIDQFKSLCTSVIKQDNDEIWGQFGEFVVLTYDCYNENIITIYEPTKVGWTHITYSLPYEYEKAYKKLNDVILILKLRQYNEKIVRINKDF